MDGSYTISDSSTEQPQTQDVPHVPTAIDLSHHLSELAKARRESPLKSFSKYMGIPGIISLAGGLPDPSYFPFESISAAALSTETFAASSAAPVKQSWFASLFGGSPSKPAVQQITVPKYVKAPTRESIGLSNALQYGAADGLVFLQNFLREWTSLVSPPAYSDWSVLVDDGSTDGWHKVVELLCNPGDPILVESWTYPSAIESGWAMGVRPVPVDIDSEGLVPAALERTLKNWNSEERGCKRPRVLYTVPVGENPTGSVISIERRKAVYDVCCKYDVILVEDDPYYILQFPYDDSKEKSSTAGQPSEESRLWIKSLSPSYLTFDYQGRVIRLDTFSKTIAPGSRLGWITTNNRFSERLLRASEVSTQQPSGFSQLVVSKLLETWGMDGWIRWLRGLQNQYEARRDVMVNALRQGFKIEVIKPATVLVAGAPKQVQYVGYAKYSTTKGTPLRTFDLNEKFASFGLSEGRKPLISFSPPEGGMFCWINVYARNHKTYRKATSAEEKIQATKDIMNDLWETLAKRKVLVAPGAMFSGTGLREGLPDQPKGPTTANTASASIGGDFNGPVKDLHDGIGHFRMAFSYSSHDVMREGIKIFADTVTEYFEE